MLRIWLTASLMYFSTLTAFAQQIDGAPFLLKAPHQSIHDWPDAPVRTAAEIIVVTRSHPRVRRMCRSFVITAETLLCTLSLHRPPIFFQRDDVATLTAPASHAERNAMLVPIALSAISLVGSFFVPLGWSIALRVFAGLFFSVLGAMGIGATGSDHGEIVLYQRPDLSPSVTRRS